MRTEQLYYAQQDLEEFAAEVVAVTPAKGGVVRVELDVTAFYPEGGGQPSDQGEIVGPSGSLTVKQVRTADGGILHEGSLKGALESGDEVTGTIKWPRRRKYMRIHTAGHLLHDVLTVTNSTTLTPLKGSHGDKAFLEYGGELDDDLLGRLAPALAAAIAAGLPVKTWETSVEELTELGAHIPSNLPSNKALRAIRIGDYTPMPDGGVHVADTSQIGEIIIHHINPTSSGVNIRYGVK